MKTKLWLLLGSVAVGMAWWLHPSAVFASLPQPAPASAAPDTREFRALLEHSCVTGRRAHAFMQLFARNDIPFLQLIDRALVPEERRPEAPVGPSAAHPLAPCLAVDQPTTP